MADPQAPARPSVRWGIGDAVWAYVAGLVGAVITTSIAIGIGGANTNTDSAGVLAAAFLGQYGATVGVLVWVSRRKGLGSPAADFGLRVHPADWWVIGGGALLEIGLSILLLPLSHVAGGKTQEVVQELHHSSGAKLTVLA